MTMIEKGGITNKKHLLKFTEHVQLKNLFYWTQTWKYVFSYVKQIIL